jgi:hypothetical protein
VAHFYQAPTKIPTTHQCRNNNYLYSPQMNVRYSLLYKLLKETRRSHSDALQLSITYLKEHYVINATDNLHKQIAGL